MGRSRTTALALLPLFLAACSDCGPYLKRATALADRCDGAGARAQLEGVPSACRDAEGYAHLLSRLEKPNPDTAAGHVARAAEFLSRGDDAGAWEEVRQACELDSDNRDARFLLDHQADVTQSLALSRSAEARLDRCEATEAKADLGEALRLWQGNEAAKRVLSGWASPDIEGAKEQEANAKLSLARAQEKQAAAEIARACRLAPETPVAPLLLAQMEMDPKRFFLEKVYPFSAKSFPYTVQPGDSLSKIAAKFLKDENVFYALARYNGLTNPSALASGQAILVPGEKPFDVTPPTVWATPAGGRSPKPVRVALAAQDDFDPRPKIWLTTDGTHPASGRGTLYTEPIEIASTTTLRYLAVDSSGKVSGVRDEIYLIVGQENCKEDFYKKALQAWKKQDLEATVAEADRALACDPENHNAATLRVQAIDALVNLGRVAFEKGDCAEAVAQCDRALRHDPDNKKALQVRKLARACKKR